MIHVVFLLKKMLSQDWAFYNLLVCLIPWFICRSSHTFRFRSNPLVILVLCIKHFGNTLLRNETLFTLLCDNFVQEAVLHMSLLVYVWGCFACMDVCASLLGVPNRGQRMVSGPLELKFQKIVIYHVGSENWTGILWRGANVLNCCHLSSLLNTFFRCF